MKPTLTNILKCNTCGSYKLSEEKRFLICNNCGNKYKIINENTIKSIKDESKKYYFDDIDISDFSQEHNTPFFLFSEKIINKNYTKLKTILSELKIDHQIYYSLKTNFNNFLLEIINKKFNYASAASILELSAAMKAGFKGSDISYDGPVMRRYEVEYAIENGVKLFNIDSIESAVILNETAVKLNKKLKISLRLNFNFGSKFFRLIHVFNERFGFSYIYFNYFMKKFKTFKNLNIIGLGFHLGSQISNVEIYLKAFKKLIKLIYEIDKKYRISISHINIGGGFPALNIKKNTFFKLGLRYLKISNKSNNNRNMLIRKLLNGISIILKKKNLPIKIFLQPGRSIVGDAGILITKIYSIKKEWVFLDASNNFLPETFLTVNRDIINISKLGARKDFKYSFAGRTLCADIFNINVNHPRADIGDIIVINSSGAYSLSRANNFTTLTPPIWLITESGQINCVSSGEEVEDVIRRFK
ncbi:hypothetical protein KAU33_12400 [Candidatus Dependentiae bacterium]|nr:hypothetical protein [Candidatus Dependentiae bacterium]